MRTYSSGLKIAAGVTLAFFVWSYGPIWQAVAFAATPKGQGSGVKGQVGRTGVSPVSQQTSSDRFEKALEDIREKVGRADDKAGRGETAAGEIEAIKAKRTEIEKLDIELKKEFAATEMKLKNANLPKEILDRHYKFVKHYEDNFKELNTNLAGIEQGAKSKGFKEAIQRAKLHLEKTKPPKKHVPLDPNKLPHRMVKAKARLPRLKKEEFEKDFPPQKKSAHSSSLIASNHELKATSQELFYSAFRNPQFKIQRKPILVAANGPLTGLLSSNQEPVALPFTDNGFSSGINPAVTSDLTPNSELSAPNYQVAQATVTPPTADDLSETPEVQFTPEIQALATQLNHNPVKIYEWVRNNIEFVPTYGSIQGADMCFQTRQCNSIDTASLLLALLRTSNIPAHYVYGTIEVPIEKVMNWVGGFTDLRAAITLIASGGIPITGKLSGGKIVAVRMEHSWVETYIPYGNYRGAIMDDSIKTWIPMDGSFKQYTYTNGFDMTATVPFSQDAYLSQVQSQNAVHYYQSKIQEYLDANMPDTSIVDVKGYRQITQETYHFLPSTLPYVTVAVLGKYSAVPGGMAATATFTLSNPATGSNVSYSASTYDLAGKRVTVSYLPATSVDEALITSYGGFLYNVPAYMLNLVSVLKVEGAIQLTGEATTLGSEQNLAIQFSQPSGVNESINKKLIAGAYYAVGMDLQGVNENVLGKRNYTLTTNVLSQTAGTLGNDDFIGEHLHILAMTYFLANDKIYKSGAKLYNTTVTRTLSEGITSFTLSVSYIFGISKTAMPSGVNMDVAMDRVIVVAKDGNASNETAYMNIAGLVSSYHEHDIFEKIDGFSSVSTVKALQTAAAIGLPIQHINATNINQMLPTIQVSSEIKADIQNAVNAGKEIAISQTNVQIDDWNGVGYIVKDPMTGAGSYMISGGLAGSDNTKKQDGMQIVEIHKDPNGWAKDNADPQTRNTIATVAELEIGEKIAQAAVDLIPQYPQPNAYNNVGTCVGVVRKAYMAAGICLDEWSGCLIKESVGWRNGIRWIKGMNGVKYLYDLADKMKLHDSVRRDAPLIGDMVFFKYTDDPNIRDHVGVVISVAGTDGTMTFVDATDFFGVSESNMNLLQPSDPKLNKPLLSKKNGCTRCYAGELFDGFGTVRNVVAQPTTR